MESLNGHVKRQAVVTPKLLMERLNAAYEGGVEKTELYRVFSDSPPSTDR